MTTRPEQMGVEAGTNRACELALSGCKARQDKKFVLHKLQRR